MRWVQRPLIKAAQDRRKWCWKQVALFGAGNSCLQDSRLHKQMTVSSRHAGILYYSCIWRNSLALMLCPQLKDCRQIFLCWMRLMMCGMERELRFKPAGDVWERVSSLWTGRHSHKLATWDFMHQGPEAGFMLNPRIPQFPHCAFHKTERNSFFQHVNYLDRTFRDFSQRKVHHIMDRPDLNFWDKCVIIWASNMAWLAAWCKHTVTALPGLDPWVTRNKTQDGVTYSQSWSMSCFSASNCMYLSHSCLPAPALCLDCLKAHEKTEPKHVWQ